ncbi:E3 SUMO-protein ligase ZBED1-like [Helicoverpa zea]|uniref:E3 SUMO-protein ligase ZBED1-like n=1 Tax=Helicoverpa zea TaxID=7113 RepID=UPI001F578AD9|nr:E3 SUMO-protein ligase ZBED1-like [Helicoverpa zea]
MSKRKSSPLWNHFEEVVPGKKAKCGYCSRVLAVSSSSIGSLSRHMKSVHPTVQISSSRQPAITPAAVEAFDGDIIASAEPAAVPSSSGSVQGEDHRADNALFVRLGQRPTAAAPTMADYVQSKKTLPRHRVQQLDEQLVRMIAKGYHALRLVDEVEFRKFVEMLNPGYTLPTRKTLSESLLPKVYNKVLETVKKQIAKAAAVCITTDAWTSCVHDGYIAVTAHFIDTETHKVCTVMIGCLEFEERHTSANLKGFLEAKFQEWNISQFVNVIVSDNAANILSAVRLGGWRSLPCYAHTLNLVVQGSLDALSDTMDRVKGVIEYFHRSHPAKKKLVEIQEQMHISPLKLKQDVTTRWNSTYDALNRLLRMKEALIATLAIMRPDINLPQDDWIVIEKATEVLKPFYEVTTEISGEQYVSASKYIVLCKIINRSLSKYSPDGHPKLERLHNALKQQMAQRFGDVENKPLLCEATILDPRFKKSGFSDLRNFEKAVAALKLRIGSDRTLTHVPVQEEATQVPAPQPPKTGSIWDDFDEEISALVPQNPTAAGIVEFDKYLDEPLIKRSENPLLWWSDRKGVYPRLYRYMLKRLNIAATSSSGKVMAANCVPALSFIKDKDPL